MAHKCPHCGNKKPSLIEDNGCSPKSEDFTLLCVAPIDPKDSSFDPVEADQINPTTGKTPCGFQWCPNG